MFVDHVAFVFCGLNMVDGYINSLYESGRIVLINEADFHPLRANLYASNTSVSRPASRLREGNSTYGFRVLNERACKISGKFEMGNPGK